MNLLNEYLYNLDPASTCCKENDCTDEYELLSEKVIHKYLNQTKRESLYKYLLEQLESDFSGYFNSLDINKTEVDRIEYKIQESIGNIK